MAERFPGKQLEAAALPGAAKALGDTIAGSHLDGGATLPGPLLLAPHRMPARHVVDAVRALTGTP